MAVDDAADHVGKVGPGFDADELAGLNQRRNHRPVRGSAVRARKESIFPGHTDSGRWTRVEDSWVSEEQIGWAKMDREIQTAGVCAVVRAGMLCKRGAGLGCV